MPGPCWALAGAGKTLELEGEGQLVAGEAGGRPELICRWEPKPLGSSHTRMALAGDVQKLVKFTVSLPQPGQPLREACLS